MDKLVTWREHLPVKQLEQSRLAGPFNRMECATLLARLAMNIGSDAHMYAVRKLVATLEQAEQIKQGYEGDLVEEVEALYQRLTDRYLILMDAIPQQFVARLITELEHTATASGVDSLVSKVRTWLIE
jgi:hypothetical protein